MRSEFFRMAPGCQIPDHHHSSWVQVAVTEVETIVLVTQGEDGNRPQAVARLDLIDA